MKKSIFVIACLFAIYSQAQDVVKLEILHTNDTHSCIMPLSVNFADTAIAGRGGFVRRMAMLDKERAENPSLMLFDSGDFSQGSTFYTIFKGDVEIGLMNLMHYDAVTIGNHEFDFGLDNLLRLVKAANFPFVCANYDFSKTQLAGFIKPYTILYRNGLKIGVFGLSPKLSGLVFANNYKGVVYSDPVPVAEKVASYLKNDEHCDLVICLSHLGWDIKGEVDDKGLMPQTDNIDVVLGGHSHSFFNKLKMVRNKCGQLIPNDQNGSQGIYVGKLYLEMVANHSK
jgi:5'-nucleotidase